MCIRDREMYLNEIPDYLALNITTEYQRLKEVLRSRITVPGEGEMTLFEMFPYFLEQGKPVIIGWNDWAGHYQVAIGYDNMGTETTADDVVIIADPYDTTDHRQDGYTTLSAERFIYDYSVGYDPDVDYGIFVVASPEGYE